MKIYKFLISTEYDIEANSQEEAEAIFESTPNDDIVGNMEVTDVICEDDEEEDD